ncbi:MAG: ABC transporter ATP-binding protein [Bdellovibrionales bacterium]|nr:ABC transporter ATP-binding protein [Bdellovibrionales bacterium]
MSVKNLNVRFDTSRGSLHAVRDLSFELHEGEVLGIVGESGSGKSVSNLALMGLLPSNSNVSADEMLFHDVDLQHLSEKQARNLRGGDISMIFQDPMTSLNPCYRVGTQIEESIKTHQQELDRKQRKLLTLSLLDSVGIADSDRAYKAYPHEMSGGMCQRAMIAMAMACNPKLMIADEPTTALDVTIQAQILGLLESLREKRKMSMILVTHDIGVVVEYADRVLVMYAGEVVESGPVREVIDTPKHPYTRALLRSLPAYHEEVEHRTNLPSLEGMVPDLVHRPMGCQLHTRCLYTQDKCRVETPTLCEEGQRKYRCFFPIHEESSNAS